MGDEGCAAQCMRKHDGYSKPCAECMGGLVGCTVERCLGLCMLGQGKDCQDCTKTKCDPGFAQCAGLPLEQVTCPHCPPGLNGSPKVSTGGQKTHSGHNSAEETGCHNTAWGSQDSEVAQSTECTPDRRKIAVRCCVNHGKGATPSQCYRSSYSHAVKHCAAISMRLCTEQELPTARDTGCNFDEERVWTSDSQNGPAELPLAPGPVIPQTRKPTPSPSKSPTATPPPPPPPPPPATKASITQSPFSAASKRPHEVTQCVLACQRSLCGLLWLSWSPIDPNASLC